MIVRRSMLQFTIVPSTAAPIDECDLSGHRFGSQNLRLCMRCRYLDRRYPTTVRDPKDEHPVMVAT